MFWNKNLLFCEIHPICYLISEQKEICKRHIKNFRSREKLSKTLVENRLPNTVSTHSSGLIKKGPGIDPVLQYNKAENIAIACKEMNGMIIRPGEVFSFWQTVGKTTKRKHYKDGRVLIRNKVQVSIGGGLCNLGNTIHCLVLHSPLDVVEFHSHSDALAPDNGKRVPFSAGTSISYNYIDYKFKNNTDQEVQLLLWCENERLYGELRSEREFPYTFNLSEEGHHFHKEQNGKFYRISKIFKNTMDKATKKIVEKKLVLDNHSEVMFDYDLIPKDMIS